jgi:hypothetical protein
MSQTDRILAHLMAGESITQAQALKHHRCTRLAAVIHILKMDGYQIDNQLVSEHRRGGKHTVFARYTLKNRRRARCLYAQRVKHQQRPRARPRARKKPAA